MGTFPYIIALCQLQHNKTFKTSQLQFLQYHRANISFIKSTKTEKKTYKIACLYFDRLGSLSGKLAEQSTCTASNLLLETVPAY